MILEVDERLVELMEDHNAALKTYGRRTARVVIEHREATKTLLQLIMAALQFASEEERELILDYMARFADTISEMGEVMELFGSASKELTDALMQAVRDA